MIYIDVILPLPLEGLFTYSVHANDAHKAVVGKRVACALRTLENLHRNYRTSAQHEAFFRD